VLNLSDIRYISSSGLGLLIKYYQKYRNTEGTIKLSHIPSHIWITLNLVGINNIFEIFNSDKDAIISFKDNLTYQRSLKSPKQYPSKFTCPSCRASLEFPEPAKYRCQHCNTYFSADQDGKVKAFLLDNRKLIEVKLSALSDNAKWIASLTKTQAEWLGFSEQEIQEITWALDEVWKICTDNDKKPWFTFRVTLCIENNPLPKITIGIISFESIGVTKTLLTNTAIKEKLTNLEVIPLVPSGELIKIIKQKRGSNNTLPSTSPSQQG
jgi:rubredoxin